MFEPVKDFESYIALDRKLVGTAGFEPTTT